MLLGRSQQRGRLRPEGTAEAAKCKALRPKGVSPKPGDRCPHMDRLGVSGRGLLTWCQPGDHLWLTSLVCTWNKAEGLLSVRSWFSGKACRLSGME